MADYLWIHILLSLFLYFTLLVWKENFQFMLFFAVCYWSLFVFLSIFWSIVLHALLQFTDSDCRFGNYNFFLNGLMLMGQCMADYLWIHILLSLFLYFTLLVWKENIIYIYIYITLCIVCIEINLYVTIYFQFMLFFAVCYRSLFVFLSI
jgi:hypothetical protein